MMLRGAGGGGWGRHVPFGCVGWVGMAGWVAIFCGGLGAGLSLNGVYALS